MKLAIIGAAGVRTPLLVKGLATSDLPLEEIGLYDIDQDRLAAISSLVRKVAPEVKLRPCSSSAHCIDGASFVLTSIRVDGIVARARDEASSLQLGFIGQETVGPAGFALAMRTIGPMIAYGREVERLAPRAWMINFTNPVGIITQAVRNACGARFIGICDTPTELFEDVAHVLGLPARECRFDYAGLNHLGWLREVLWRGQPQLGRLFDDPGLLERAYRRPLFDLELLRQLRLLPTEYLYYYYRTADALANLRRAGTSRGQSLVRLNDQLFRDLAGSAPDKVGIYERYLADRDGSYMQLESGATTPKPPASPWAQLTGYDKIALAVIRAIHFNSGAVLPLNVLNRGNLPELEPGDSVEVPCVVDANGPHPLHVGEMPQAVRELLRSVKRYERLTIEAALSPSRERAVEALAANPVVGNRDDAARLVQALGVWR